MDVIAKECKDSKEKKKQNKRTIGIKEKYTIRRVASSRWWMITKRKKRKRKGRNRKRERKRDLKVTPEDEEHTV